MTFVEQYTRHETGFGLQTIRFVISDNFQDLFKSDSELGITEADYTDVFDLGATKQDLNLDEGSFAVDELSFVIDASACTEDIHKNALAFCLEAKDIKKNRFCVKFFNPDFSSEDSLIDCIEFFGKVSSKVSGKDDKIEGNEYDEQIDALREYSFTAFSFDISILSSILFNEKIETETGTKLSSLYSRIGGTDITSIFKYRLSYASSDSPQVYCYYKPLASLWDALSLYFAKSNIILNELFGVPITMTLVESSLGFNVAAEVYTVSEMRGTNSDYNLNIKAHYPSDNIVELKLTGVPATSSTAVPFIHRRMIDPAYGQPASPSEDDKMVIANEREYSFKSLSNMAEFLYEIARDFGCYLFIRYTSGSNIEVEFRSRKDLISSDYTYIIDEEEGSINTSSVISNEVQEYYGLANNLAVDGVDVITNNGIETNGKPEATDAFKNLKNTLDRDKDKNIKHGRLMLTSSVTFDQAPGKGTLPLNFSRGSLPTKDGYDDGGVVTNAGRKERLHTGIYIKTTPNILNDPQQKTFLPSADTAIWRPVSKIYNSVRKYINNEWVTTNELSNTLAEYVSKITGRDKHYYEAEYKIKVPYWNGFAKKDGNGNITSKSWKNIQLGTKIPIKEKTRLYNATSGQWEEFNPDAAEFVVVGIERSSDYPETSLTLHYLERFAYGLFQEGKEGDTILGGDVTTISESNSIADVRGEIDYYECQEAINAYDAVMVTVDSKLITARSHKDYYHRPVVIALQSGETGDIIACQINGVVKSDLLNFDTTKQKVYARTPDPTTGITSISQSILPYGEQTDTENVVIDLGEITGPNSFAMKVRKWAWS